MLTRLKCGASWLPPSLTRLGAGRTVEARSTSPLGRRINVWFWRDEAVSRGIDLVDFGTVVTAEDFESVRRALGIARWNVFGVSYGTTVVMTMTALPPETIWSAVFDLVYPPDPVLPPWELNVADAREAFFAACDTDSVCRAASPDAGASTWRVASRSVAVIGTELPQTPAAMQPIVNQGVDRDHAFSAADTPTLPRQSSASRR